MSTNKNHQEEVSVEEKLTSLIRLQQALSDIDKIKILRGELPLEVEDLESEITGLKTRIENFTANNKLTQQESNDEKQQILAAQDLISKYEEQKMQVKNNREYDYLEKEIELQQLEIQVSEKRIKENKALIDRRKDDIKALKQLVTEKDSILEEKKAELDVIIAETKHEEDKLRETAKVIEEEITPRLLTAFKRIRKSVRNGLAVVPIGRDACGGCYNKIPPQRQLDIKLHKKIIVCEYCGRIMVDPEMVEEVNGTTPTE